VLGDWPDEAMERLKPDSSTAVVTLTHDPKLDDPALEVALKSDALYVGSLGSRRTHEKRKARLIEAGITEAQFARIHGPVGLNIGAKSPSEIAISIMAEIIQTRAALNEPAERKVKAA
jgi:xanthine dehydrogenase accessory factor